jgi:hypothetical protein
MSRGLGGPLNRLLRGGHQDSDGLWRCSRNLLFPFAWRMIDVLEWIWEHSWMTGRVNEAF